MKIPVMRPRLPSAIEVAPLLRRMDASGIYSNHGPLARELEAVYANFLGVPNGHCVTCANATLAIQGALEALDRRSWTAPAYTFAATGQAVLAAGAELVLADVDPGDWALDPKGISETSDHGVLAVAPFGAPVDLSRWAGRSTVVVDAAASLGSSAGNLRNLPRGWAACFSLHATKVLPAGEGALAVFGSMDDAERFRQWTNFGFDSQRESQFVATNAKMSEIHAAYALASFVSWPQEQREWMTALKSARRVSENVGVTCMVQELAGARPYWVVRFSDSGTRSRVEARLADSGIETRNWWPALLSDMPAFIGARMVGDFPTSRALCSTTLGLPLFRGMRPEEFAYIEGALHGALEGEPGGSRGE